MTSIALRFIKDFIGSSLCLPFSELYFHLRSAHSSAATGSRASPGPIGCFNEIQPRWKVVKTRTFADWFTFFFSRWFFLFGDFNAFLAYTDLWHIKCVVVVVKLYGHPPKFPLIWRARKTLSSFYILIKRPARGASLNLTRDAFLLLLLRLFSGLVARKDLNRV